MSNLFDLTGKIVAITGGGGVLCGEMAVGLAQAGASVAVLDLKEDFALKVVNQIKQNGGKAIGLFVVAAIGRDRA